MVAKYIQHFLISSLRRDDGGVSFSIHFGKSGQEVLQKVLSVPSVLEPNLHRPGNNKIEHLKNSNIA